MTYVGRHRRWLLVAIAAGGCVLRLRQYAIGRSLWLDEVLLASNFRDHDLGHLLEDTLDHAQSAPAGFLVGVELVTSTLGLSDPYLRLVPFAASLVLLSGAVLLAEDLFRHMVARAGFVFFVATSPVLVYYASEVKQYGVDAAVTTVLLVCLTRAERWRHGIAILAAAGALAVWVSLPAAFVVASIGLVLAVNWLPERRFRDLGTLGLAWSVSTLGMAAWSMSVSDSLSSLQTYWQGAFAPGAVDRWYVDHVLGLVHLATRQRGVPAPGAQAGWTDWWSWVLLAVVVAGVVVGLRRRDTPARNVTACLVVAMVLAIVASGVDLYPFASRPLLFLTPLVFVAIASVVDEVGEHVPSRSLGVAVFAVVTGLMVPGAVDTLGSPINRSDTKAALDYVDEHGQIGDEFAVTPFSDVMLRWYADRWEVARPPFATVPWNGADDFLATMARDRPGRTWILVVHDLERARSALEEIRSATPELDRYEADNTGVYLFDFDDAYAASYQTS